MDSREAAARASLQAAIDDDAADETGPHHMIMVDRDDLRAMLAFADQQALTSAGDGDDNDAPEARLDMARSVLAAIVAGADPIPLAKAGLDFCNLTQAERETMRGESSAPAAFDGGKDAA